MRKQLTTTAIVSIAVILGFAYVPGWITRHSHDYQFARRLCEWKDVDPDSLLTSAADIRTAELCWDKLERDYRIGR